jgi:hypothetical protein
MLQPNDILEVLDNRPKRWFPRLDTATEFLCASRLTAYAKGSEWALVFETLVFAPPSTGLDRVRTWLYTFGTPLAGPQGNTRDSQLHVISEGDDGPIFSSGTGFELRATKGSVRIRGKLVSYDASAKALARERIPQVFPPKVCGPDWVRLVAVDHRESLLATDQERRARVAPGLRKLLELDEWRHPDISEGEIPSDTETFQLLADAIAQSDPKLYRPRERPNNHWRNWPRGGML